MTRQFTGCWCEVVVLSCLIHFTVAATACGGSLTQQAGVISSPNFPNAYPRTQCEWTITVADNQVIEVRFQHLDLNRIDEDSCHDYLTFYDGPSRWSPVLLRSLCGYQNQFRTEGIRIRSRGHELHIRFNADSGTPGTGFSLSYWAHECQPFTYGEDECTQNCTCDQENTLYCTNLHGSCICKNGWTSDNCTQDTNECLSDPHLCPGPYSVCVSTNGGFECKCKAGLLENATGACEDQMRCSRNCSHACGVISGPPRQEKCYCPKGMKPDTNNPNKCIDCPEWTFGDDCAHRCNCHTERTERCDKHDGLCHCFSRWAPPDCTQNINECLLGNSPCNTTNSRCYDTTGAFECRCYPGYEKVTSETCEQCGRVLINPGGTITSSPYADRSVGQGAVECYWTIKVDPSLVISLTFQEFSLYHSSSSYLRVFDGENSSASIIGTYYGSTYRYRKPDGIIRSSRNLMHIVRTSQSYGDGSFKATYWSHECNSFTYDANCTTPCTCVQFNTKYCNSTTGQCVCKDQWQSTDCSVDVDECQNPLACPDYSVCNNTQGSFNCTCKAGLTMKSGKCEGTSNSAPCSRQCSHLCVMSSPGTAECLCPIGMELDGDNCTACRNMTYGPDCSRQCPCDSSHASTCDSIMGTCICHAEWTGSNCLLDANECVLGTHECQPHPVGGCINEHGSYRCQCLEENGYEESDNGTCIPIVPECGQALNDTSGSFTSPNYPNDYFNYAKCTWTITVVEGDVISLRFSQFDTQYSYDFVTVFEYDDAKQRIQLGYYSGQEIPSVTRSTGNEMFVEFISNAYYRKSGFNASYTSHPCPLFMYGDESCDKPCPCVQTNTRHCVSTTGNCICKDGWMARDCSQDVNECLGTNVKLCQDNSDCINTIGGYNCSCHQGFVFNISTGECVEYNDCIHKECSHACYMTGDGEQHCSCPDGLIVDKAEGLICVVPYYPYGTAAADNALHLEGTNVGFAFISEVITFSFGVPFGTVSYKEAFVFTNGVMSFGLGKGINGDFDLNYAYAMEQNVIAAFWAQMDKYKGESYYQLYEKCGDSVFFNHDNERVSPEKKKVMDRAESEITKFHNLAGFEVATVIVATWENVEPQSTEGREESTFQAVYISGWPKDRLNGQDVLYDEQRAYIILMYQERRMNWRFKEGRRVSIGTTANGVQALETATRTVELLDNLPGNTGYNGTVTFDIGRVGGPAQKCHKYLCTHANLIADPHYKDEIRKLYKCPCTLERLGRQWQLFEKRGEYEDVYCYAISAVAKRRLLQGNRRNKLCCYKWVKPESHDWEAWLESRKRATYISSTESVPSAGHILINDPWQLGYRENMQAQKWCCGESSRDACDKFYKVFPDMGCTDFVKFVTASALGDPHITTLDGLTYTMNGWGEYIMMDIGNQNFTLQARTGRAESENGILTNATVFTAFAAKEGSSSHFQVELAHTNTSMVIIVNGLDVTNDFYDDFEFDKAADTIRVSREFTANRTVASAIFPCGVSIAVHVGIKSLEIQMEVDKSLQNQSLGLLGNFNERIDDEFTLPIGFVLSANISEREIYRQFAQEWRVTQERSVFIYDAGEDTDTYQHPEFVPMFRDEADQQSLKEAEAVCGHENDACIFDYLVTQDRAFAENTKTFKGEVENITKTLQNRPPTLTMRNDSGIRYNQLVVYNGTEVTVKAEAEDEDNDAVDYILVGDVPMTTIDQTGGKITFTPFIGLIDALRLQAVDEKGSYSPILQIALLFCSGCNGRGECITDDIQMVETAAMSYLRLACKCFPAYTGLDCESELNGCDSKPCGAGQNCTDLTSEQQGNSTIGYTCGPCPQGFEKVNLTCIDVNECSRGMSKCAQNCINTEGSYKCSCRSGYRLSQSDKKTCEDIDECAERSHKCEQICTNHPGNYSCGCREGYALRDDGISCNSSINVDRICQACEQMCIAISGNTKTPTCACNFGFEIDPEKTTKCRDVDECVEGNSPCNQLCNNTYGGFTCSCNAGFQLEPDRSTCTACQPPYYGVECEKVCQCNGRGSCDPLRGCVCTDKWTGVNCELDIDECNKPDACPTDQICHNEMGSFSCVCPKGFQMINGTCEDIDECNSFQAQCHLQVELCKNTRGSYECVCKSSFARKNATSPCEDIDECRVQSNTCEQVCQNMPGGYNCKCFPGYRLAADRRACVKEKDLCQSGSLNCSHGCSIDVNTKQPHCFCSLGYELLDDKTCVDINECQSNSTNHCSNQAECINTPGEYMCSCPEGYKLDNDKRTCIACQGQTWGKDCAKSCSCGLGADRCDPVIGCVCKHGFRGVNCQQDIDECSSGQLKCNISETCVNLPGNATCECEKGYERHGGTCEDFDECSDPGKNSCSQECTNFAGGYKCSCFSGYLWDETTKTCTDIDECSTGKSECDQVCVNTEGGYRCSCSGELLLQPDGLTCRPKYIDECLDPKSNSCDQNCTNTVGSFKCFCKPGFTYNVTKKKCEKCPANHWGMNCSYICINCETANTVECDPENGRCLCKSGWTGNSCDTDIDECLVNSSFCSGIDHSHCTNTDGGAICVCDDGFVNKSMDGKNLICEDECFDPASNPCDQNCTNIFGSFECSCKPGFKYNVTSKKCEKCPANQRGMDCSEICICKAANTLQCDPENGQCHCKDGWTGNTCDTETDEIPDVAAITTQLVFDFNASELDLSKGSDDYKRISKEVGEKIFNNLKKTGLAVICVTVLNLRKGSLEVDSKVEINKTQEPHPDEALISALIKVMNDEDADLSIDNQNVTLSNVFVSKVSFTRSDGSPCTIKLKLKGCSGDCIEEGGVAICRASTKDDSYLAIGLGVSLPAFLILTTVVAVSVYYWTRKQKKGGPKTSIQDMPGNGKLSKGGKKKSEKEGLDNAGFSQAVGNSGKGSWLWKPNFQSEGDLQKPMEMVELRTDRRREMSDSIPFKDQYLRQHPVQGYPDQQVERFSLRSDYHDVQGDRGSRFLPRYYNEPEPDYMEIRQ